jgi:hypothetical protein
MTITPLESSPLVVAIIAQLETAIGDGNVHWAGAPRDEAPPFAVIWPDAGMESPFHRSLTNQAPNELRFQITSVGAGPEQAQWVADRTAEALLSTVLVVSGRRCWPTVREGSQPVRRDDDSTDLWLATAQYLTRSDT